MAAERKNPRAAGLSGQLIYNLNGQEAGNSALTFDGSKLTAISGVYTNLSIGTATITTSLSTSGNLGFYGKTPVSQPAAIANITTTATSGVLPTANSTVTIADADAPTVTELLEYCVELETKVENVITHLRTLGLIAT